MTDDVAFRLAIAAAPDDDLPRLAYADWCQENARDECPACYGTGDLHHDHGLRDQHWYCPRCNGTGRVPDGRRVRAAYIRRGCGLPAPLTDGPVAKHEREWRKAGVCPKCGGEGKKVYGGHTRTVDGVTYRACTLTEDCPDCWGTGDVGGLLRTVPVEWPGVGRVDPLCRVEWGRGFPASVQCRWDDVWQGDGPTAWAKAVTAWHPVTKFVVADKRPDRFGTMKGTVYGWADAIGDDPAYCLPPAVWAALDVPERGLWKDCDTEAEANTALHTALARLARAAGSSPAA